MKMQSVSAASHRKTIRRFTPYLKKYKLMDINLWQGLEIINLDEEGNKKRVLVN